MTTPSRFSRRSLFQSLGGALLLAPIMRAERALAQSRPIRRFLALFNPNGTTYRGAATPSGPEVGFSFGSYYQALERHRAETLAFTGLRIGGEPYGTQAGPDGGHGSGGWGCFTCTSSNNTGHARGPSIDQLIARKLFEQGLAPTARAPVFRVGPPGAFSATGVWKNFYEDAGRPVTPLTSPTQAYASLFGNFMPGAGTVSARAAALVARKRSVLDSAWAECKGELDRLPAAGRVQLEYHCERIRDVERALQAPPPSVPACTPPQAALTPVANLNPSDANNYPALTAFFFDLIAAALTCDVVRVAGFGFGETGSRFAAPWLNAPVLSMINTGEQNVNDHHSHTHGGTEASVGAFMKWYCEKYAELIDRLKVRAPDGTRLIDSTIAHWGTEYGTGPGHPTWGVVNFAFASPQVLKTGRLMAFPVTGFQPTSPEAEIEARTYHAMMVTHIQAMGITGVNQFGDPQGGSGPLAGMAA